MQAQQFNEELEDVRNKVMQMGGIVEEQLGKAVRALVKGDTKLAEEVEANDYRVNRLEVDIDEECTHIVARRQPAASDLRLVMAVNRTINELERIGDEIKSVGKMVREELDVSMEEEVRLILRRAVELEPLGHTSKAGLGSRIAALFTEAPLDTPVEEWRGSAGQPADFES